ncbi:MAG: CPBP family intramembrane metalloprotease [Dehalococcoidia bacterium]|nr:CPBP family intramembrane metalloprotease [Dehalococcoidia bacterium]
MPWTFLYVAVFAGLVWLLDSDIDPYPAPLPRSLRPRRDITLVLVLWAMAMGVNALRVLIITPYLTSLSVQPTVRELLILPLVTLFLLAVPWLASRRYDHHSAADLGLTWRSRSTNTVIFACVFGTLSGAIAFSTGQTVVGVQAPTAGALLLLIYNNAFLEEFFFRGVIQNRLERLLGQRPAVWGGAVLFAASHVLLDVQVLGAWTAGGWSRVLYALLMQTLGGCLLGLIFIKSRTLWPGVVCHYLVNWLPSILSLAITP